MVEEPFFRKDRIRILSDLKEGSNAIAVYRLSSALGHRECHVQVLLLPRGVMQVTGTRGADARVLYRACMERLLLGDTIRRGWKLGYWGSRGPRLRVRGNLKNALVLRVQFQRGVIGDATRGYAGPRAGPVLMRTAGRTGFSFHQGIRAYLAEVKAAGASRSRQVACMDSVTGYLKLPVGRHLIFFLRKKLSEIARRRHGARMGYRMHLSQTLRGRAGVSRLGVEGLECSMWLNMKRLRIE